MINNLGEILTKSFESLKQKAYRDTAGVLTIGWGHTSDKNFTVTPDSVITKEFAETLFKIDISEAEKTLIKEFEKWHELSENQYAALVDFVYNRGTLNWHSGRHTQLYSYLCEGKYMNVANSFLDFVKDIDGNILKGLLRRRQAERILFLSPDDKELANAIPLFAADLEAEDFEYPHDLASDRFEMSSVNIHDKPEML